MLRHHKKKSASQVHTTVGEINPGGTDGWYDISDSGGGLGSLVEIAGSSISQGGHTWNADDAYWFWQGTPFPSTFRIALHASGQLPNLDPANASPVTSSGPFDTSSTVNPVTGGSWWAIQKNSGGNLTNVGWLNIQGNGTQYWYETSANAYLTIGSGEMLVFTSSTSAPTNAMYQAIATPIG